MADLNLQTIIYRLIEELSSGKVHCMIYGEYNFLYYGQMVHYAPIYLCQDTVETIELTEDGFKISILLCGQKTEERLNIRLRFDKILKICSYKTASFCEEQVLFVK
jgi:hypothetical protein